MLDDLTREKMVEAVLQCGLDDWVDLGELNAIALFYRAADRIVRAKITSVPEWAIEPVIRDVVHRGLMRIGDVYTHGHFVPYDGTDDDAINWMMKFFRDADGGWPVAAWLALTDEGIALAKTLPRAPYLDETWPNENEEQI